MLRRGRDEPDADERSAVRRDAVGDDYLDDDDLEALEDLEEPRSFFERGWVRALLVLAALAVVLVVSLPYLMRWIDLSPPPPAPRQAAERPTPSPAVPAPVTQAAPIAPATTPVTPAAPAPPAKTESAAPPVSPAPAPPATATGGTQAPMSGSDGAAAAGKGDYWVQVGAFGDAKNAERLAAKLRDAKMPVEVTRADRSTTPHVVRAGAYPTRAEAEAALKELRATGVTGFVAQGAAR